MKNLIQKIFFSSLLITGLGSTTQIRPISYLEIIGRSIAAYIFIAKAKVHLLYDFETEYKTFMGFENINIKTELLQKHINTAKIASLVTMIIGGYITYGTIKMIYTRLKTNGDNQA